MLAERAGLEVEEAFEVSVAQALIRLRGHAFGHDCQLSEVAQDVVSRRLRFADGPDEYADA